MCIGTWTYNFVLANKICMQYSHIPCKVNKQKLENAKHDDYRHINGFVTGLG